LSTPAIERQELRLALPSKGRLAEDAMALLSRAGLRVHQVNPRQLTADIPAVPGLVVLFQRSGDIPVSVREGTVEFGIAGRDVLAERRGDDGAVVLLLDELGFGHCRLCVIVPESWADVRSMADLAERARAAGQRLRVATKFPELTKRFFAEHGIPELRMLQPEGTLEVAPAIGYADLIVDLVASGLTMQVNRLRALDDGEILASQACLFANRAALKRDVRALALARRMIEFIAAQLRAEDNYAIFANMRGDSPEAIAARMAEQQTIGGLQGPTISQIVHPREPGWYAVHIVVRRDRLYEAIGELRDIGGSGVVVAPVTYIFEEEPEEYRALLAGLEA